MSHTYTRCQTAGKRLAGLSGDGYTFYITPCNTPYKKGFRLSVEPEFRYNGTQSMDGWFPRYYDRIQDAKAALTRFMGGPVEWKDITDTHNTAHKAG